MNPLFRSDGFPQNPQDALDHILMQITARDNPYAYSVYGFIFKTLKQYRLLSQHEVEDVLFEAYLRGKRKLAQGEIIERPMAWMKGTSFHICQEWSRKLRREPCRDPMILDLMSAKYRIENKDFVTDQIAYLTSALQVIVKADTEAAELLMLRVVEEMSWAEIRKYLRARGECNVPSVEALRQRGSRIKRALRQAFHEIEAQA